MFSLCKKIFVLLCLIVFTCASANAMADELTCPSYDRPGGFIQGTFLEEGDYGDYYMVILDVATSDEDIFITCQADLVDSWFGKGSPVGRYVEIGYNESQFYFLDNDYCYQNRVCTSGTYLD